MLSILSNLFCLSAHGDIYKCQEKNGAIVFMDAGSKDQNAQCKLILKETQPRPSGTRTNQKTPQIQTPDFPSVDSKTQQKRDEKRKQILLNEFNLEQQALTKAQAAKESSEILAHQKNIALLTKEINALK